MQIVIEMPKEKFETFQDGSYSGMMDRDLFMAIKNGVVLPEKHGDLIDRDSAREMFARSCVGECDVCTNNRKDCLLIINEPTVLEGAE